MQRQYRSTWSYHRFCYKQSDKNMIDSFEYFGKFLLLAVNRCSASLITPKD